MATFLSKSDPWIEDSFVYACEYEYDTNAQGNQDSVQGTHSHPPSSPSLSCYEDTQNTIPSGLLGSPEDNHPNSSGRITKPPSRQTKIVQIIHRGGGGWTTNNYNHSVDNTSIDSQCPPYLIIHDGKFSTVAFLSPESIKSLGLHHGGGTLNREPPNQTTFVNDEFQVTSTNANAKKSKQSKRKRSRKKKSTAARSSKIIGSNNNDDDQSDDLSMSSGVSSASARADRATKRRREEKFNNNSNNNNINNSSSPPTIPTPKSLITIADYTISTILQCLKPPLSCTSNQDTNAPTHYYHSQSKRQQLLHHIILQLDNNQNHVQPNLVLCLYISGPITNIGAENQGLIGNSVDVHCSARVRRAIKDHYQQFDSDSAAVTGGGTRLDSHSTLLKRLEGCHLCYQFQQILKKESASSSHSWPWKSILTSNDSDVSVGNIADSDCGNTAGTHVVQSVIGNVNAFVGKMDRLEDVLGSLVEEEEEENGYGEKEAEHDADETMTNHSTSHKEGGNSVHEEINEVHHNAVVDKNGDQVESNDDLSDEGTVSIVLGDVAQLFQDYDDFFDVLDLPPDSESISSPKATVVGNGAVSIAGPTENDVSTTPATMNSTGHSNNGKDTLITEFADAEQALTTNSGVEERSSSNTPQTEEQSNQARFEDNPVETTDSDPVAPQTQESHDSSALFVGIDKMIVDEDEDDSGKEEEDEYFDCDGEDEDETHTDRHAAVSEPAVKNVDENKTQNLLSELRTNVQEKNFVESQIPLALKEHVSHLPNQKESLEDEDDEVCVQNLLSLKVPARSPRDHPIEEDGVNRTKSQIPLSRVNQSKPLARKGDDDGDQESKDNVLSQVPISIIRRSKRLALRDSPNKSPQENGNVQTQLDVEEKETWNETTGAKFVESQLPIIVPLPNEMECDEPFFPGTQESLPEKGTSSTHDSNKTSDDDANGEKNDAEINETNQNCSSFASRKDYDSDDSSDGWMRVRKTKPRSMSKSNKSSCQQTIIDGKSNGSVKSQSPPQKNKGFDDESSEINHEANDEVDNHELFETTCHEDALLTQDDTSCQQDDKSPIKASIEDHHVHFAYELSHYLGGSCPPAGRMDAEHMDECDTNSDMDTPGKCKAVREFNTDRFLSKVKKLSGMR